MPGRNGDVVFLGIVLDDLGRPGIGIHHGGDAEHHGAADGGERHLGPDRAQREAEPLALLAAAQDAEHDARAGDEAQHPAPQRPDGARRAIAADQHIGVVHRRHGDAGGEQEGDAAIGDEAAQRDDEGGDLRIGGERAVQRADERAENEAGDDGDDPDRGMADAEHRPQLVDLQRADGDGDGGEHRAHRQVDLAHDDDQHHAGGHDRDRRGLDQQRPQVARRQELAAEQPVARLEEAGRRDRSRPR